MQKNEKGKGGKKKEKKTLSSILQHDWLATHGNTLRPQDSGAGTTSLFSNLQNQGMIRNVQFRQHHDTNVSFEENNATAQAP